jgi:hypothetical protein
MLKKNSWIVALLIALSITAFLFTGCVKPLDVEEDTETYEEYPLDKGYNAWAGQVYQKGWAIGGIKFQGKGDAIVIAKDLGYDIDMFQRATKLKIEMPDASYPRSGVDIIWGGEDENGDSTKGGGMWNQQPIAGGSGDIDTTFAKKDGNVLIIDLRKALKNYSAYTKAAKLKIVMQVNAPSYGDVEGLVQKAFLMIPNTPPPFASVTKLELKKKDMLWTNELPLDEKITPSDATEQKVIWAIKGFRDNTTDTLISYDGSEDSLKALKTKVWWAQEEYTIDNTVWPNKKGLRDVVGTIYIPGEEAGTVYIQAFIKNAVEKDGKLYDFPTKTKNGVLASGNGQQLTIDVKDPQTFAYKINGTAYGTVRYGAVDNGGVSGGTMDIITKDKTPIPVTPAKPPEGAATGYTGYEILYSPTGGQYGNSAHYVEIRFPINKTLNDYKHIKLHYTSENCDLTGKSVRIKAMTKKPGRTYNPGPYIATTSFSEGSFASGSSGKDTDITFELYKDHARHADGETKEGIFNKGQDADLSSASTDSENAGRYEDDDGKNIKSANVIYFWVLPWGGVGSKFTISDIEFNP